MHEHDHRERGRTKRPWAPGGRHSEHLHSKILFFLRGTKVLEQEIASAAREGTRTRTRTLSSAARDVRHA